MTTTKINAKQRELALDVMTNAVESGAIGPWTTNQEWDRDEEDHMIQRLSFEVLDEDIMGPREPRRVYVITPEKVINAMERIAIEKLCGGELYKTITGMWATNDYLAGVGGDAETDDAIIQVASIGSVEFG